MLNEDALEWKTMGTCETNPIASCALSASASRRPVPVHELLTDWLPANPAHVVVVIHIANNLKLIRIVLT